MEIKLEVIQILEDKLFNNSFVKDIYHFKDDDDVLLMDQMGVDLFKFNRLIENYKVDNLLLRYYREIYDENYPDLEKNNNPDYYDKLERENRLPNTSWSYSTMPLGLYDPCNDEIILDMNSIYKCADDNNFDPEVLRIKVLFHEIGHRLTRFGEERLDANNSKWMCNSFYQELIAQLIAYHCVDEEGKKMMKKLSKQQDIKYQTYLKDEYHYLRESVDDLFRLILSVEYKNITKIKSSEDLKTAIGATILKPKKDLVDEFNVVDMSDLDLN